MAEAETENQALDVEALIGILQGRAIRQTFPLGPSILITTAERDAIIAALERTERLEAVLREVWDSIPSSYDTDDPMVQRHAAALNALGSLLAPAPTKDGR